MEDTGTNFKEYSCINCGAIICVDEHKCPYCGGFNYPGAEKKYFRDLNHIKDNLEQLEDIPKESYKREASAQIRRIIKTLIITSIIIVLIYGTIRLLLKWEDSRYSFDKASASAKDQLLWDKENFPILDEWYEKGEYDKLVEYSYNLYREEPVYTYTNWKHQRFLWFYEDYSSAMEAREKIENKEDISLYDITRAIYGGLNICYNLENADLDKDEIERLEPFKPAMEALLFDTLKFTEEEASQLYNDNKGYSYIDYEKIEEYAAVVLKRLD
ncbi:MAG TPA: hypothetical protein GXZ21_01635 [Clostridiales bacterium]|nr:hypothetical protein [Clostridiales bacterium]